MSRFNEPVGTRRLSPCDLIAERECKGTLMNRGFANFFDKKSEKMCIFCDFRLGNDDFLEWIRKTLKIGVTLTNLTILHKILGK